MSDELRKQMEQIMSENLAMKETLQTPPPNDPTMSVNPKLDSLGLDLFAPHMTANAYNTFLSIVHWAILCQKLFEGKRIEWDNGTYAAMQAPFVGFGNPHLWETTYATNVGQIVHHIFFNWQSKGHKYREKNPLPRRIIEEMAGSFANKGKGWKHTEMVQDLVADEATYKML